MCSEHLEKLGKVIHCSIGLRYESILATEEYLEICQASAAALINASLTLLVAKSTEHTGDDLMPKG